MDGGSRMRRRISNLLSLAVALGFQGRHALAEKLRAYANQLRAALHKVRAALMAEQAIARAAA